MNEEKKSMYIFDPNIVDDAPAIGASKIVGRHGNKGVISSILPEKDLGTHAEPPKVELILSPLSIYNRIGYELEIMNILSKEEPGYYQVEYISKSFFDSIFAGITLLIRKKTNTRKERRILRRAHQALGLKRIYKVVYITWSDRRVYCVEGK
jgi:DNA-directed RNA polymerase beta subunit